ncbi:polysaccharide pyruvyl transferase family protein [Proteobacteria bacterium 005FR1]|nr:polysaccharide pyruvyl transferase family protein [Proteobacteria bacterium 005FR1]
MPPKRTQDFYSHADSLVDAKNEYASAGKQLRILMLADISGMGPAYHVGDEAMAEVSIKRLKQLVGSDNLVMACASPEAVPATYGIAAVPLYSLTDRERRRLWFKRPHSALKSWLLAIYQVIRSDVVFVCGGGNLTSVWPATLESRLWFLSIANFFRRRVILVSQTLGPFSPEHRERCNEILARADWVGVRDKSFSKSQVDVPVHFAVDDAVFLEPQHSRQTRAMLGSEPLLAVSLRQLGGTTSDQLQELAAAINRIAGQRKMSTIFIPHHSPGGGGDLAIAKAVQQSWSTATPFRVVDPIARASALKALTRDADLVISMRYHQIVFALSTGVPAVGICTDRYTRAKLKGAFEQFGLEPRVIPMHSAVNDLPEMVEQVLSERERFQRAARHVQHGARENNMKALAHISAAASGASLAPRSA